MQNFPDFNFEKEILATTTISSPIIAGVDEVGRGALSGPVVAGCVAFDLDFIRSVKTLEVMINDSKKMSAKQRENASEWIKNNSLIYGVGIASVGLINTYGIKKATEIAIRKAVAKVQINLPLNYLLLDAFYVSHVRGMPKTNQKAIIKGDAKSISIAAASIIAKVYRDDLMIKLAKNNQYSTYGWEENKGYGTKKHILALQNHGTTRMHRKLFIQKIV